MAGYYYVISDSIYEDSESTMNPTKSIGTFMKDFDNIENKKKSSILTQTKTEHIISIPLFSKKITISPTDTDLLQIEAQLKWKEYLKGVR